ncbi:MAG: hypothetical protein MJ227_04055 [Bacilli bacterium]|nr:hypothetical protein [Bacilli bacterium]
MKKKLFTLIGILLLSTSALVGCQEDNTPADASYYDATEFSRCGMIYDFSKESKDLHAGDKIEFTVEPFEDYSIAGVFYQYGETKKMAKSLLEQNRFQITLGPGKNGIMAYYNVDPNKNFVDSFKLPVSPEDYSVLMKMGNIAKKDKSDYWKNHDHLQYADLNTEDVNGQYAKSKVLGGIEEMMTETNDPKDFFINFVDGDTTHFNSRNYGYSVKARYLGINTPESTSVIEEWGKAASNYNKSIYAKAKHIIVHGQIDDIKGYDENTGKPYYSFKTSVDGNKRTLCYIWYSEDASEFPDINTFKCVNLEMLYEGYTLAKDNVETMGEYFFDAFQKAYKSAQVNKRKMFSGQLDPDYYFDNNLEPVTISIADIYHTSSKGKTDSRYCDNYTFYKVEGYVSRKIGDAFYIQNQPSYNPGDEAFGLYVFTYTHISKLDVGNHVEVIGVLSEYGGTYQLQGISYSESAPNPYTDTKILENGKKYEMVPIKLTMAEFYEKQYDHVLVEITDVLYCHDATGTFQGVKQSYSEGGSHAINKYNEAYPFFNTTNKIVTYANLDSSDTEISYSAGNTGKYLRFVVDQDILVKCYDEVENITAYSPVFFYGGSYLYNFYGAEWTDPNYHPEDTQRHAQTVTESYSRKKFSKFIAISQNYVSTSEKTTQYTAVICAPKDVLLNIVM